MKSIGEYDPKEPVIWEDEEEFDLNKELISLFKHSLIYIISLILIGIIVWNLIN